MENFKKKSILTVVLLSLLTLGLAACSDSGSSEDNDGLDQVTYSAFDGLNGMAVRFGGEKGFFEDEGIDIEFVVAEDEVSALTSGDVDIADGSTTRVIVGAGRGAPIKMIASMYRTQGPFYLQAGNDIDSVEDLKGQDIGVGIVGSGMDVYARYILEEHGIDPDNDVNLIDNGTYQQGYATLQNEQVDATMIHEPFVTMGEESGESHLLAQGWDYLPDFHTGVIAASDSFIEESPEVIERFLEAYHTTQEYAKNNQEEYIDYVVEHMDIDPEVLEQALDREDELWTNDMPLDVERLVETQNIQLELGFQEEEYDIESMIDTSFVPEE
ncbi:ABC transporter substrate-binding protein [Oceanobacillus jeddahense]|uniref:ABC transporter substrate-binding protein n=1 Tax=Oceanobacillus jeddahense TaxID=1462527 RepID=A0ABY5JY82_9BACI|nr:ABC transporter substrate-binding protein [Oceanobacillus jeddahense]UUI04759.1 ABC transporter substrate-binding protein [Oceanobacillus jeddahense]